jgi:hypothetical protein
VTSVSALSEIDFTDLDNFASGFPHSLFDVHRREAPVYWHAPTENTPDAEGFWSVATYAEMLAVLKDPVTFLRLPVAHGRTAARCCRIWPSLARCST